jgi:uncharacterized membrane protein YfcA
MTHFLVLVIVGFLIGGCGTLIGAGGGFILVPLLILTTHPKMPPNIITAISIAVVAANAISGSIAYAASKRIDYKAGLTFGAFTIPGSITGVFLVKYIPIHLFDILFGILLMILAGSLFINNGKDGAPKPVNSKLPEGSQHHSITDKDGEHFSYNYNQTTGIIISILVGFLSPLLGIGGGIIHVPAMVQWLQFPVYIATATSHFILAIMSTVSVIVHIFQGSYNNQHVLRMVIALCIGVVPGAQAGAFISHRVNTETIIKILAGCLGLVGVRILLLALI